MTKWPCTLASIAEDRAICGHRRPPRRGTAAPQGPPRPRAEGGGGKKEGQGRLGGGAGAAPPAGAARRRRRRLPAVVHRGAGERRPGSPAAAWRPLAAALASTVAPADPPA